MISAALLTFMKILFFTAYFASSATLKIKKHDIGQVLVRN